MAIHDFRYMVLIVVLVLYPVLLTSQTKSIIPDKGWKVRFDGSKSKPVIHHGILYIGSLDGSLYAFDSSTGQKIWEISTGSGLASGPEVIVVPAGTDLSTQMNTLAHRPLRNRKKEIHGTPVISDGILCVGSEDFSIYAVDILSGKTMWTFETNGRVNTKPIVDDERVFFVSEDGLLYVLDKFTGEKKMEAESYPGARLAYSQPGPFANPPNQPVHKDGNIYLTNWVRGTVKKVYVSSVASVSGESNWIVELEGWDVQDPILVDNQLFILYETNGTATEPSNMRVYAIDASTGDVLWTYDQKKIHGFKNFSADSETVYFESPSDFFALDARTGVLRWQYAFDEKKINLPEKSYFANKWIYLVEHGSLVVLDPKTGSINKTLKVDRFYRIHFMEDGLAFGTSSNQVHAMDTSTGKTLWTVKTNAQLSSEPVYQDGMIYFTTNSMGYVGINKMDQGHLYAVNAATGN
ncbi:MAG: PQQ-binding-like beta-propeller repeat protein [Cyclobacteriaceae bacterium]